MAALSLALLSLLLLGWLRNDLLQQWQATLPPGTPNHFLINIQPDQREALTALLREHAVEQLSFGPMAIARIEQINGVPASQWRPDADPPGRRDGTVNLSWRASLPDSNRIIRGAWFDRDDTPVQISLAEDWAASLDLAPGDTMRFRVGSETRSGTITSLREVDWDSFRINFFILLNPAGADGLDHQYVANFFLPPVGERGVGTPDVPLLRALAERFPNVTVYDTNALLARVGELFAQLTRALDTLFWFTLASAIVVMLITVQSGRAEREREIALWRCIGVQRGLLLRAWWLEQALLGALIGVLTALAAAGATWWIGTRLLELAWQPQWGLMLAALMLAGVGVPLLNGWLGRRLTATPPLRVLQSA
jgi:putative ABC transport system permease protein